MDNMITSNQGGLSNPDKRTFAEKLKLAAENSAEPQGVNRIYRNELEKVMPRINGGSYKNSRAGIDVDYEVGTKADTDGLFRCWFLNKDDVQINYVALMECKRNIDFKNKERRGEVILQVCCYLRQMKNNGEVLPKVVVLGSEISCCAIKTEILSQYYNSYIADLNSASTAYKHTDNQFLLKNIVNDESINIKTVIIPVDKKNSAYDLCENMIKYAAGSELTEDLTPQTLEYFYDYFENSVLSVIDKLNKSSREKIEIFISMFLNINDIEIRTKGGLLNLVNTNIEIVINNKSINVNRAALEQFQYICKFREYSKLEQKKLTAILDQLIETGDRRNRGDYYTPKIWVDEAHKLIDNHLGKNWRDEYVVWDCAWGTGNLTRDYDFSDLYCSTLFEGDLKIGKRYNRDSVKFQYDFLNDDVQTMMAIETQLKMGNGPLAKQMLMETKLYKEAQGLVDSLFGWNGKQKKKLLFLINPPYKKAGAVVGVGGDSAKEVASNNAIAGAGASGSQLYAQFLFRINYFAEVLKIDTALALFCEIQLLNLNEHKDLINKLANNNIKFLDGYMIKASNFADAKANWSIGFMLFNNEGNGENIVKVLDLDTKGNIAFIKDKKIYNVDSDSEAQKWWKENYKGKKDKNVIHLSDPLEIETKADKFKNTYNDGIIGGFWCHSNRVEDNEQRVNLYSSVPNQASGYSLTPDVFDRAISFFAARKLISKTWDNAMDQYMAPNEDHPLYKQWLDDCLIYSIFNNCSRQTSLRNIQGITGLNLYNEFFFMSRKEIADLAGGVYSTVDINTAIEDDLDIHGKSERYLYTRLQNANLSDDAKDLLKIAKGIVKYSFHYRNEFNSKHPLVQVNTWDAGWWQIDALMSGISKTYQKRGGLLDGLNPEMMKEFYKYYKAFEDRMRPLVYELGFLYK